MNQHTQAVCAAFVLTMIGWSAQPQTTASSSTAAQSAPANSTTMPAAPAAQSTQAVSTAASATPTVPSSAGGIVTPPPGYVIGTDDVLSIVYWRDKDMTTDVQV